MENELRCISHEIRNQVSICELYTKIVKRYLEQKNIQDESIDNAIDCVTRSLKLISNTLLDLRSLDNLDLKRCSIKNILKEGINLSLIYSQDKDIKISLHCDDDYDVCIDENKFLACIVNVIKNAIEAIEEKGEINIDVTSDKSKVSVKISNNGKPIEKGIDVFKEGLTTKKTGSGLGLAICKENLKMQNGEIRLNKSDKDFTEFEILIEKY